MKVGVDSSRPADKWELYPTPSKVVVTGFSGGEMNGLVVVFDVSFQDSPYLIGLRGWVEEWVEGGSAPLRSCSDLRNGTFIPPYYY